MFILLLLQVIVLESYIALISQDYFGLYIIFKISLYLELFPSFAKLSKSMYVYLVSTSGILA
jgi:hypothetical protein